MINFFDSIQKKVSRWRAKEPLSANKLNQSVDAINRIFVASASPARSQIVENLKQSPVLYICTSKTIVDDSAQEEEGEEEDDAAVLSDRRLVGAKQVFQDGTFGDVERFYPSLLNQAIGVGEYVISVRLMNGVICWVSTGVGILQENAEDFLYTGEHTELALTDLGWDRQLPPEDEGAEEGILPVKLGIKITQSTGVSYYHAGDKKIYGYVRDFTYDSSGKVLVISAERRIEVEVPTDCTA